MSAGLTVAANFSTHFANQTMLRVRKTANSMLGLADAGSIQIAASNRSQVVFWLELTLNQHQRYLLCRRGLSLSVGSRCPITFRHLSLRN